MLQVKADLLASKIRDKVVKGKDKVSDAQIEEFYNKNKARFAQPERRDLLRRADQGQGQGRRGRRRRSRAARAGRPSRRSTRSTRPPRRRAASCPRRPRARSRSSSTRPSSRPRRAQLTGPVKTQFGHYLFEVTKVTPASQQTLEQAKETIRQTLQSQNQQKALETFSKDYSERWKEKTDCREGYVIQQCKQGPKATPTPSRRRARPGAAAGAAVRQLAGRVSEPSEEIVEALRRLDAPHAAPAGRVPVGPRAGRALDRPAHRRGGLRAGRRGALRRRRQAARRARRRPLPGPLPLAAARGARRGLARRRRRARARQARAPAPAHLRRRRGRDRGHGAAQLGRDQADRGRAASPASSARCPRTCPGRCTRARSSAAPPRPASTSSTSPTRRVEGELEELRAAGTREEAFHEVGDVLFAAVNVARKLKVDPELALRAAADRFRGPRARARRASPHRRAPTGTISGPTTRSPTTPAPA